MPQPDPTEPPPRTTGRLTINRTRQLPKSADTRLHLGRKSTCNTLPVHHARDINMAASSLSSAFSSLVTFFLFTAVLLLLLPSSPLTAVHSSNVCICECCEGGGRCGSNNTMAYTIYDSCSNGCTLDFCVDSYAPCQAEQTRLDVIANCVNRDRWVNPAVIVVFLLTVTSLVALGIAKNFVSAHNTHTSHAEVEAARTAVVLEW